MSLIFAIAIGFISFFLLFDILVCVYMYKHYEYLKNNHQYRQKFIDAIVTVIALVIPFSIVIWFVARGILTTEFLQQIQLYGAKVLDLIAYGNIIYFGLLFTFPIWKSNVLNALICFIISLVMIVYKIGLIFYAYNFQKYDYYVVDNAPFHYKDVHFGYVSGKKVIHDPVIKFVSPNTDNIYVDTDDDDSP